MRDILTTIGELIGFLIMALFVVSAVKEQFATWETFLIFVASLAAVVGVTWLWMKATGVLKR